MNVLQVVAFHSTVAFIVNRPDTSRTLRPVVEPGIDALLILCVLKIDILPFVKKVCLVKLPIPVLACTRAFLRRLTPTARCALQETSLKSWGWSTFPVAAAVWGEINIL